MNGKNIYLYGEMSSIIIYSHEIAFVRAKQMTEKRKKEKKKKRKQQQRARFEKQNLFKMHIHKYQFGARCWNGFFYIQCSIDNTNKRKQTIEERE